MIYYKLFPLISKLKEYIYKTTINQWDITNKITIIDNYFEKFEKPPKLKRLVDQN